MSDSRSRWVDHPRAIVWAWWIVWAGAVASYVIGFGLLSSDTKVLVGLVALIGIRIEETRS